MNNPKLRVLVVALASLVTNASSKVLRAGTPLPPDTEASLEKVAKEVHSLKVPGHAQVDKTSAHPPKVTPMTQCAFLAGRASGNLSQQCCTNINIVTQRQLHKYGLAPKCQSDWKCESDGITPQPVFETQSLSALCGEPGCLPRVVKAMKRSPLTANGAHEVSHICSDLASLGGASANPKEVSNILGRSGKGHNTAGNNKDCKGDDCDKNEAACFPGEAVVHVEGAGQTPVSNLRAGDKVLVDQQGKIGYEPVLSFLHALPAGSHSFTTITHEDGIFRASPAHIVFVARDAQGTLWESKLVANVRVGDYLFSLQQGTAASKPSQVQEIHYGSTRSGMFAPLTYSGTIVVDGVVASNYASSSMNQHLPHCLVHAFLLPVRLYHQLALNLQPSQLSKRIAEVTSEELHPYLQIMRHLHVFVPSQ